MIGFAQVNETEKKQKSTTNSMYNNNTNMSNGVVRDSVVRLDVAPGVTAGQAQALEVQLNVYKSQVGKLSYRRSPLTAQQKKIEELVRQLEVSKPNSFEYHYFKFLSGNYNLELIDNLNKAEELKPNNSDVHVQKIAANLILNNNSIAKDYLKKIEKSGRLNKEILYFAHDMLESIPKNGTLITHGFDDSYSAYYENIVNQNRTDVTIINLDFLQSASYRSKLKKDGYSLPSSEVVDVSYFKAFCKLNESKKLYISMTVPKDYLKVVVNNLYINGLTMHYSNAKEDVFTVNETLWNNKLNKTPLQKTLTNSKAKRISSNYLPMLIVLKEGYKNSGDSKKEKEITERINDIAVQSSKTNSVKKALSN